MKFDFYTKTILTVIALSLLAIAVQLTMPNANAQIYTTGHMSVCNPSVAGEPLQCAQVVDGKLLVTN